MAISAFNTENTVVSPSILFLYFIFLRWSILLRCDSTPSLRGHWRWLLPAGFANSLRTVNALFAKGKSKNLCQNRLCNQHARINRTGTKRALPQRPHITETAKSKLLKKPASVRYQVRFLYKEHLRSFSVFTHPGRLLVKMNCD